MKTELLDALVIGAGPTGLAMASDLVRHGLRVRIIDQAAGPSNLSKAVVVMPRTLEEFELRGLADQAISQGQKVQHFSVYAEGSMILETNFHRLPSNHRFLLSLPQDKTEAILRGHLERLGLEVEWETEFLSFTQDAEGVDVELRRPDGAVERLRCAWLLGCGGAHSKSRKMLDIPFRGAQYRDEWCLGDVIIEWDYPHDRTAAFFTRDSYVAVFPMPEGRHRIYAARAEPTGETPTLQDLQGMMDRSCFIESRLRDARWLSCFHVHHRKAPSYSKGRVFLAGDAAHIHSPESGLGMNTGIQDAFNLAWKLALVHQGRAKRSLLDTYQTERSAVGRQVVRASDAMHRAWAVFDPRAQVIRNRLFRLASEFYRLYQPSIDKQTQLGIRYGKSPIVGEEVTKLNLRVVNGGPHAGTHAPDGEVILRGERPGSGQRRRLFDWLRGTHHTLLIFSGPPAGGVNAPLIREIASATEAFAAELRILIVAPQFDESLGTDFEVVIDPSLAVHKSYGASHSAAYLTRPDGYVGFRCRPIKPDHLRHHLAHTLLPEEGNEFVVATGSKCSRTLTTTNSLR